LIPITIEYALRALGCLAGSAPKVVGGKELVDRTAISSSYLTKILLQLKRGGLVESVRGSGGGYRLVRPAVEITLAQVAELVAPSALQQDALEQDGGYGGQISSAIHRRWRRWADTFVTFLEETTLAEILESPLFGEDGRNRRGR